MTLEVVPTAPGEHRVVGLVSSARGLKTEAETHTVVEGLSALLDRRWSPRTMRSRLAARRPTRCA